MSDLQHRQQKIQEKRRQTPWREFVKGICGWYSLNFYSKDGFVSKHPTTERRGNIIDFESFSNDRWWLTDYGRAYNLTSSFFDQFRDLYREVPYPWLVIYPGSENCPYSDAILWSKNTYLCVWVINDCENILYSTVIKQGSHNVLNSNRVLNGQNIYSCKWVTDGLNIYYSKYIYNCSNIWFGTSLINCEECILCDSVENKKYCIKNVVYPKERYFELKENILSSKSEFDHYFSSLPEKTFYLASTNVSWENIIRSQDIDRGFGIVEVHAWNNLISVWWDGETTDMYDVYGSTPPCKHSYGCVGVGIGMEHAYLSANIVWWMHMYYSFFLVWCSYCFGCVWLQNKSYCILNRQYTKEARHEKVSEICTIMEQEWVLGDFLPGSICPFYFNDTAAYLIDDSFTKEEVEAEGFLRRDEKVKVDIPDGVEVVHTKDLWQYEHMEDGSWHIDNTILNKVIQDEEWNVYRIVKMEYDFLVKHRLPIPRLHRLDRLRMSFKIS